MKVHCVTDFFFLYVAIKLLPYPPTLGLRDSKRVCENMLSVNRNEVNY